MTTLTPLDDRLIVEAIEEKSETAAGIIIPDSGKERPQKGKVIAAGPGRISDSGKRIPMSVKKGDTVLFSKYGPTEAKIDGKEILVLNESDVLALVNS